MKPENEEKVTGLPENAYRELKEGESYKPLMSPNKHYPEVTPWSVLWGLVMAVIFSAAAAYLGLKVGQVFEAAIPIAIIAVGLSSGFKRKNALGENVIIQSIGSYGYHASTRLRRERRKPSEALDLRRINRWFVRLHHRHLRLVGRDDQYPYRRSR